MKVKQILPIKEAANSHIFAAYTYGPIVLAADKQITDPEAVFDVACDSFGYVDAQKAACPKIKEAHLCFALPLKSGESIRLIDYASAGKTWNEESLCGVWLKKRADM